MVRRAAAAPGPESSFLLAELLSPTAFDASVLEYEGRSRRGRQSVFTSVLILVRAYSK